MVDNGVGAALHTYEPNDVGRCQSGWFNDLGRWIHCGSSQRSSVLHDDAESDFRQKHYHDGGDCMCFEAEDGPTYQEALDEYVNS